MITQMFLAGGGFLPESKAFFDAMAVQLTNPQKNAVNRLVSRLKSGGAWPYIGAMWLSTLITEQQTFLNLVNPTDTTVSLRLKQGTPTFTSGVGWKGVASNSHKLYTSGNANDAVFKMAQQDHFFLSYVSDNGTVGARMVIGTPNNRHGIMPERVAGTLSGYMGRNAAIGAGGGAAVNQVKMAVRLSSTDARVYSNKTLVGTDANAADTVIPAQIISFLTNNNSWPSDAQTRLEAVGQGSMPDAVRESMIDAINNFIAQWDSL